jgi:uncharacterized protein YjbJ (UPF0337 family)
MSSEGWSRKEFTPERALLMSEERVLSVQVMTRKGRNMNTEQLKGDWHIFKGKVREKWGQLTDDDVNVAEGKLEQLAGTMAQKYGIAKEEAQKRLEQLHSDCSCNQ